MFGGIGLSEILLIFVVALLVLGPKRLPELAKTLGRFYREIRSTVDEVKEVIVEEPQKQKHTQQYIPPNLDDEIETEINEDNKEKLKKNLQGEKISFKKKQENEINEREDKKS
ncbi:twin-arginine translocase TatA/TatE family subunit [Persephonella sp. IF05-L8]|uniref:twin-arginine translocase TatA/TatE family subunit n=1 Tax=Persephonella sp. IF05-L8 TaxID=1158338 RepID=UPI0004970A57